MTSATDELRRLLDERGVEWDTFSVGNTEYIHWTNNDGHWCAASIGGPLSLHVNILSATPEQAVEATLGSDLQAENAKLRELCGELYHELYAARDEHWPASYLGDLEPRDVFPRYDELIEMGVDA